MAVQFMDGCEHYDTVESIYLKWTNQAFSTSTPNGRNGRGIALNQGGAYVAKTLNHQPGWVISWAFNILISGGGSTGTSNIFSGNNVANTLIGIIIQNDFTLSIFAGPNRVANSSPFSIHPNSWYSYQLKYTIGTGGSGGQNATITATFKANGAVIMSCSNADTGININSLIVPTATTDYHIFSCPNIIGGSTLDDVVIADLSGNGSVNDFFGDVKVGLIQPASDSTPQRWSPSTGSTRFNLVNSQFPEDSAGYIFDSTPGDQSNFDWQTLPSDVGRIIALHYGIYARKDNEGTRAIQPTVNGGLPTVPSNSTFTPHSAPFAGYPTPIYYPGDSYCYYFFAMDSQPGIGTPTPWTVATVNATTFGVDLYA